MGLGKTVQVKRNTSLNVSFCSLLASSELRGGNVDTVYALDSLTVTLQCT